MLYRSMAGQALIMLNAQINLRYCLSLTPDLFSLFGLISCLCLQALLSFQPKDAEKQAIVLVCSETRK